MPEDHSHAVDQTNNARSEYHEADCDEQCKGVFHKNSSTNTTNPAIEATINTNATMAHFSGSRLAA